jgi:hypothetical protein
MLARVVTINKIQPTHLNSLIMLAGLSKPANEGYFSSPTALSRPCDSTPTSLRVTLTILTVYKFEFFSLLSFSVITMYSMK